MSTAHVSGARRFALPSAALGLLLVALALPAAAQADAQGCYGNVKPIARTAERDTGVAYQFTCRMPAKAFAITSSREITGFDVSADVFDTDAAGGGIRGDDRFGECEGEIPSFGFSCAGTYSAYDRWVRASFDTTDDPCARDGKTGELLLQVSLVVQSATGKLNGPYLLGRPKGCPHPHVTSVKPGKKKAKTKKPAAKQGRRA